MTPALQEQLTKLEEAITYAAENHGDTEVREAIMAKAEFFMKNSMNEKAKKTYLEAYEKTVGISNRLEIYMIILQILFQERDFDEIRKYITKCKALLEEGGDWERKNKLKVYEGLYCLTIRDFTSAAKLLIDSLSTFSSPELLTFDKVTFYAVISGLMTLERAEIRDKLVQNSEVLSIIRKQPELEKLLDSYYRCKYRDFFHAFLALIEEIKVDENIGQHTKYIVKELRVMIYSQFLESYKSVTLECMAETFGVSVAFLDRYFPNSNPY